MRKTCLVWIFGVLLSAGPIAHARVEVSDDLGERVFLFRPAERIVSLSPALVENLYAAGAGEKLVGVVEFSDYPQAAGKIPQVGNSAYIDLEALVALKPDLVFVSKKWNQPAHVEKLRTMDIAVYVSNPRHLEDIASELERMGILAGTSKVAAKTAENYRQGLALLKEKYGGRPRVDTFYQAWKQPLVTVNREEFISQIIALCGGRNIFADLKTSAPTVSIESVIAADPEAIVASGMGEARPEWLDDWKRWPLQAVTRNNLFFVPPGQLQRDTPRLLEGARILCEDLEKARQRWGSAKP